ncbi:MAG: hypothetical protein WCF17_08850 [Terracidiphilus sp.]
MAASLVTTGYAVPLTIMNPCLAGAIFVDYLVRGRYPLVPRHPDVLGPDRMAALTYGDVPRLNQDAGAIQSGAAVNPPRPGIAGADAPGMKAIMDEHE